MKSIFHFIKTTCLSGIFFLIPLGIIVIILGKLFHMLTPIADSIANNTNDTLLGVSILYLVILMLLLIICFIIGLISKTKPSKITINWLEERILCKIPGYTFMKNTNENIYGINQDEKYKVVLVKDDENWSLAFEIEPIDEEFIIVFFPSSPHPWSGEIKIVPLINCKNIEMSYKNVIEFNSNLGTGYGTFLKGKLSKN